MREDVITCDVCEESTVAIGREVWTNIKLHVAIGMCRVARTIDLCPQCQDSVFLYLRSMNETAPKVAKERKTFL